MLSNIAQFKLFSRPVSVQYGRFVLADFRQAVEKVRVAGAEVFTGPFHGKLGRGSKTDIGGYQAASVLSTAALKRLMPISLTVSLVSKFGNRGNLLKASASDVLSELKKVEKCSSPVVVNRRGSEAPRHGVAGLASDEQNTVAHGAPWVALGQGIHSRFSSLGRSYVSSFIGNSAGALCALGVCDGSRA